MKPTPEQLAAQEAARAARAGGAGTRGAAGRAPARPECDAACGGGALAVGEDTVDWVKVFQAAKLGDSRTTSSNGSGDHRPKRGISQDIERHLAAE